MYNYEKAEKAYAEAFNGINVKENEKIVLKSKSSLSYYFAKDIKGANIKDHEKIILDLKDPQYSYFFCNVYCNGKCRRAF